MSTATHIEPTEVDVAPALAVQVERTCGSSPEQIGEAMRPAFGSLERYVTDHGLQMTGPPRAIYTSYDATRTTFTVAFPVAAVDAEPAAEGDVTVGELPAGSALRFSHVGPYEKLMQTYGGITEWLKSHDMLKTDADWAKYMPMWEEYVGDPTSTPPDRLLTYIYVPKGKSD